MYVWATNYVYLTLGGGSVVQQASSGTKKMLQSKMPGILFSRLASYGLCWCVRRVAGWWEALARTQLTA